MKKLIIIAVTIFLFSCSKEKEVDIVGDWIEEAAYGQENNIYGWTNASELYDYIHLKADGKYIWGNSACGNGAGGGTYQFSYPARELKFGDDNFNSVSIYKVEIIDENHIILISPHTDNIYRLKIKFRRN
jgi:hypothetical protein